MDGLFYKEEYNFKLTYNLQFFAGALEKTEDATPKKLEDARKEGQVAKSMELISAISLVALFVILKVFIGYIGNSFLKIFKESYSMIDTRITNGMNTNVASQILRQYLLRVLAISLPVFISAVLIAFLVNYFQVKWKVTSKPLQPKFSKINPLKGIKKIFSKEKLFELLKSVLKIGMIGYVVYTTLVSKANILETLFFIDLFSAVMLIGGIVIDLGIKISMLYLIIGFADLAYQKLKFKKDMKMTKQEVKDEYKNTEGDPLIKGKIKQRMREASTRRMMSRLPEADVVITNPTHFACAVLYDRNTADAPILIAKGADYMAEKIKDGAREHGVPIVENKPLARMLYYNVEIDEEIPPELWEMMVEVLTYVYSLKGIDITARTA